MAGSRAGEMLLRTLRAARVSHRPILLSGSTITGVTDSRNSRIPPSLYRQAVDLRVGGSRSRDSSEAKNYCERTFDRNLVLSSTWVCGGHGIRGAFTQREEGHHEKEFHSERKKNRVRCSIWLCAHRDFCLVGLQHGSRLGQDIERGGEKTQDAADAVKRRM